MKKKGKIIMSVAIFLIIGIIIFFVSCGFIVVVGNSMNDTYKTGDLVFYRKTQSVVYNDIIVFHHDGNKVIKRVVGVPGDVISIKDNVIYRNGEKDENGARKGVSDDLEPVTVGDGYVFVVGDNLSESKDSRTYGAININTILGRVI